MSAKSLNENGNGCFETDQDKKFPPQIYSNLAQVSQSQLQDEFAAQPLLLDTGGRSAISLAIRKQWQTNIIALELSNHWNYNNVIVS